MNVKQKPTSTIIAGTMFLICFLVGSNSVGDKFHIVRYIAISLCMSLIFSYYVFTTKKIVVSNTKLFYITLIFILLSGQSMIWATDFGEAVFAFSKYIITFLTALVFYNMFQHDKIATKKMICFASCAILVVYLIVTFIQIIKIQDNSFEQLYNVTGMSGHKNMLSLMFFCPVGIFACLINRAEKQNIQDFDGGSVCYCIDNHRVSQITSCDVKYDYGCGFSWSYFVFKKKKI